MAGRPLGFPPPVSEEGASSLLPRPPGDNAAQFNFTLQTSQHQSGGCKLVELLFILSVNQECAARLKLCFSWMHKIKFEPIGSIVNKLC